MYAFIKHIKTSMEQLPAPTQVMGYNSFEEMKLSGHYNKLLDQFKEKVSETFGQIMNGTLDATEGFKMLSKDGIEIATNAEAIAGTSALLAITPASLRAALDDSGYLLDGGSY